MKQMFAYAFAAGLLAAIPVHAETFGSTSPIVDSTTTHSETATTGKFAADGGSAGALDLNGSGTRSTSNTSANTTVSLDPVFQYVGLGGDTTHITAATVQSAKNGNGVASTMQAIDGVTSKNGLSETLTSLNQTLTSTTQTLLTPKH